MTPVKPKGKQSKTMEVSQPEVTKLSYEQALAELEKIVASLEANEPGGTNKFSLEESMSLFERGQALTRHCLELLDKAELRVKQLSGDTLVDMQGDV
ncbi:MAG TPA: exodeoxyribonuclease VII small subunit [Anaerolineales bacterium]